MKKKMGRRILSFVLSLMMVFTALWVGGIEETKAAATVVWKDAEMENFWSGGVWSHNITDWTNLNLTTGSYTDAQRTLIIDAGATPTATPMYFSSAIDNGSIKLTQTIANLPAGTYTLTAPMIGNNAVISFVFGDETSTTSEWLSGWSACDVISETFTIDEDQTNVTVGISITCGSGGYSGDGFIDSLILTSSNVTVLSSDPTPDPTYEISVSADKTSVETGGDIVLTATVKENGTEIQTLPTGLTIAFYPDGTGTGKTNATYSQAQAAFTDTVTLKEEGEFYFVAKLYDASWNPLAENYITLTATGASTDPVYTVEATVDKTSLEQNGTVKLTAVVKKDGVVVPQDQLDEEDLQLWWWADKWKDGHTDGLVDATFANYGDNNGYSLTADATLPSAGTYYIMAELRETAPSATEKGDWVTEAVVKITTTSTSGEAPATPAPQETKPVSELANKNFTSALDGTWTCAVNGAWGNGNSIDVVSYSSDAWLELPSYVGTTGAKFSMNHGETMTVLQWLESVPAGTYTITAPVMGENTDIYLVLGDQEVKATSLSGYNNWSKARATFTITEDMTDVKVGFKLVAKSSGSNYSWGWIDSISLVKGVPATGDTTNVMGFVALMVTGAAMVAFTSVKRRKENF